MTIIGFIVLAGYAILWALNVYNDHNPDGNRTSVFQSKEDHHER